METVIDFCISHYWMGVIIGFVCIFLHLKIRYVTDFDGKFRKEHYLLLVLSFLSWLVPVGYIIGFICWVIYFVIYFIFTFFLTY